MACYELYNLLLVIIICVVHVCNTHSSYLVIFFNWYETECVQCHVYQYIKILLVRPCVCE